jgi:putative acetyltransferase
VTVTIRPSRPDDAAAILAVVSDAFSGDGRDAREELDIVRNTWVVRRGRPLLELVADDAGAVVAHAQAAPGRLGGRAAAVAGVAPVCVAPDHQRRGTGTALMRTLIVTAEELRWPLLVILGEPAFYGRFGFEAAGAYGITYGPAGAGNPHFQARRLPGYRAALRGEFGYCWE